MRGLIITEADHRARVEAMIAWYAGITEMEVGQPAPELPHTFHCSADETGDYTENIFRD